jgi:plasmid stabilization system protein ParE
MMFRAILLPSARIDIDEAANWYQQAKVGLGRKFTSEIRKKIEFICKNPQAIAFRYKTIRTATLDSFPFLIHYQVDSHSKTIIIIAVLHTSRNPEIWNER